MDVGAIFALIVAPLAVLSAAIRIVIYVCVNRHGRPIEFNRTDIANGTNDFVEEVRDCSQGSFGHGVFKGTLAGRRGLMSVAVKCLPSSVGAEDFRNAVNLFYRVRHNNLVTFVGFSDEEGDQMLVYEFMPKGSLHDALHGKYHRVLSANRSNPGIMKVWPRVLTWRERLEIVLEAAQALQYLHANGVDHGDVSSKNILLADDVGAKLADFGLNARVSNQLAARRHPNDHSSMEKDICGFGVVLLEVICGTPAESGHNAEQPRDREGEQQLPAIFNWVVSKIRTKSDIADKWLGGNYNKWSMQLLLNVALECIHRSAAPGDQPRTRAHNKLTMTRVRDDIFRAARCTHLAALASCSSDHQEYATAIANQYSRNIAPLQ